MKILYQRNFVLLYLCLVFAACATNPFAYADTAAQKAYAYGRAYNITLESALAIVTSPATPEHVKAGIRAVERQTTPVIDALDDALTDYEIVRAQFAQGMNTSERLTIVANNLENWTRRAELALAQLSSAIGKGREFG